MAAGGTMRIGLVLGLGLGLMTLAMGTVHAQSAGPGGDDPGVVSGKLPLDDDEGDPKAPVKGAGTVTAPVVAPVPAPQPVKPEVGTPATGRGTPASPITPPSTTTPAITTTPPSTGTPASAPVGVAPEVPTVKRSPLGLGLSIGGGVLALGMAGVLIDGTIRFRGANGASTLDDRNALVQRGRVEQIVGGVGVGIGVAAAAIGLVTMIQQPGSGEKLRTGAWILPSGGGLVAEGRF